MKSSKAIVNVLGAFVFTVGICVLSHFYGMYLIVSFITFFAYIDLGESLFAMHNGSLVRERRWMASTTLNRMKNQG